MKTQLRFLVLASCLALAVPVLTTQPGCTTTQQQSTVPTLVAIGQLVDSTMTVAAGMYHNGQLTEAQWIKVSTFYDHDFQPAYALAKQAAQSNLSSPASPDVLSLATQFVALVASYQSTPTVKVLVSPTTK